MDVNYVKNHVKEELDGAKDYVTKGINANDYDLIEMGIQEVKHAKYFLNKLQTMDPAQFSETEKIYSDTINFLTSQLTSYGEMNNARKQV